MIHAILFTAGVTQL